MDVLCCVNKLIKRITVDLHFVWLFELNGRGHGWGILIETRGGKGG